MLEWKQVWKLLAKARSAFQKSDHWTKFIRTQIAKNLLEMEYWFTQNLLPDLVKIYSNTSVWVSFY